MTQFITASLNELDRLARSAEQQMNSALDQRQWDLVLAHRNEMLAIDAERTQRLHSIDDLEMAP